MSIDFVGVRVSISGVGFRRADGAGFPSYVNVLCWDDQNRTWIHFAHIKTKKPGHWEVFKTVVPKVTTTALIIYMRKKKKKHIELG